MNSDPSKRTLVCGPKPASAELHDSPSVPSQVIDGGTLGTGRRNVNPGSNLRSRVPVVTVKRVRGQKFLTGRQATRLDRVGVASREKRQ